VANETIDDVSSVAEAAADAPIIVMVSTGITPTYLVLPATGVVELGRRIVAGKRVEEVDDERMSREHATVRRERNAWRIADQKSRNGTYVDGARLEGETVRTGDVVLRLGATVFILVTDGRGYDNPPSDGDTVIGPELARVYDQVRRLANESTLLIQGASGAGKELVAELYHASGPRRSGPFVAMNCATVQENLAEGMLFGTRKGAFTEAVNQPGYIQAAHGGTLFLDEIAELPLPVQAKLLRVLESREVVPLGTTTPVAIDFGVVAASHRALRTGLAEQTFRQDLYYRLSQPTIHLPPLSARKVDITRLVVRELAKTDRTLGAHAKLIEACCTRPWPGNVRELLGAVRNAAKQALANKRDVVRVEDLPPNAGLYVVSSESDTAQDKPKQKGEGDVTKAEAEAALASTRGNVTQAAKKLGLHRNGLNRVIAKFSIARIGQQPPDDDNDDN
jgi:transcriptional regulator with PAS, ATPase and Fis domain